MKWQLFFCLANSVDFYHTFCLQNHWDGKKYLSTQSISNFEKLHSLREEYCECVLTAPCLQLFVLVLMLLPSVLLNVAVLCSGCCWLVRYVSALLPALECSFSLEVAGCHVLVSGTLCGSLHSKTLFLSSLHLKVIQNLLTP